jgi:uncharacterized protein YqjF (DUF2071 family)
MRGRTTDANIVDKNRGGLPFKTSHRPWPVPDRPWSMLQTWNDLLFAHWPIDPDVLRRLMPRVLEPETFNGQAWVAVVPFWMSGVRLHRIPALPGLSTFAELNVRTYVNIDDKPGVFFFSLDAANRVAVEVARRWFHLPYLKARMAVRPDGEVIHYSSVRTDRRGKPSELHGWYQPTGPVYRSDPGTLEHWLTERYCLYAIDRHERIYRADILHNPWPLQTAKADFTTQTMLASHGIVPIDQPPLLHFAKRLDVAAWTPERIAGSECP